MRYSALFLESNNSVEEIWHHTDMRNLFDKLFDKTKFIRSTEDGLEAYRSNPNVTIYVNGKRTLGIVIRVPEYHPLFNAYLISHEDDMCLDRIPGTTFEHGRVLQQLTGVVGEYIERLVP